MNAETELSAIPDENVLKDMARAEMVRLGISQNRLAKESGINQTRLSQWFNGKYAGKTEIVAQEVFRWLNTIQRRDSDSRRVATYRKWELTPTAQNIIDAFRYAQNAGDIALIYGGAGLGKTTTARRYQEDASNVWVATMSPAMNTVAACLERVALAVGLPEAQASAIKTENAIVGKVQNSGGLLIIDEAQHLAVSGLDAVRSIHDATGLGIALMGNESVYARITGGSRQAHFAQLFSRVGYRVPLVAPTAGDVETIAASWGVTGSKAITLCHQIARQAGALRELIKDFRLASTMLSEGEERIGYDHIHAAHAMRGGTL